MPDPCRPIRPATGDRRRRSAGPLRSACLAAALLASVLLLSCGKPAGPGTVAVVNGESVTAAELQERMAAEAARWGGPPAAMANRDSVREEVLREIIQERLILGRARVLSLSVTDEELDREAASLGIGGRPGERLPPSWRESLRRRLLIRKVVRKDLHEAVTLRPGEAETFFQSRRDRYRREDRARALQIVLRDPRRIEVVRNRLKKGEDFAKVAREESVGPEASRGGDLGFFSRGTLPAAIDQAAFAMPVGSVSRPIRTPYGYHILKVLEREKGGMPDFGAVRQEVLEDLRRIRTEEAYGPWLEGLQTSAKIEIRKDALRKVLVPGIDSTAPKPGKTTLPDPNPERRKP